MSPARPPRSIDQEAQRRRLARLRESPEPEAAPSAAATRAILEARARRLAAPPAAPREAGRDTLGFVIGGAAHALETRWVRAVFVLGEVTPLPGTPGFVLGILHFRGRILSLLDIRKFLELPEAGMSNPGHVILLGDGGMEFGLRADAIGAVERLPDSELLAPPGNVGGRAARYLLGVTRQGRAVLDGGRLLADPAIVVAGEEF